MGSPSRVCLSYPGKQDGEEEGMAQAKIIWTSITVFPESGSFPIRILKHYLPKCRISHLGLTVGLLELIC